MARYQHTQVGWWLIVLLGGLAALMLGVSLNAAVADPNATAALRGVTVFIVLLAATFGSLTVHVGDGGVVVRFGPGPISRAIPLDAIESVRTVRNRWWHG